MFGIFLVVMGVFFLLEEMDLIQGDFWGYFWPLILIVFGLNVMSKNKYRGNCFSFACGGDKHKKNKHSKVVDDQ